MKQIILVVILSFAIVSIGIAQKKSKKNKETEQQAVTPEKTEVKPEVKEEAKPEVKPEPAFSTLDLREHYAKKRAVAARWNDPEVEKSALYDLIVEDPNNDSLIFSLAYLYFENQKYTSTILIGQDLLNRNPKNVQVLELVALGYENIHIYDRALQNYESLFLLTSSSSMLYKMAVLQYELKRYQETITNIDILLSKPEADSLKVVFNNAKNQEKEYPIRVALTNLRGLVYKAQGDKINARKYFEMALKMAPDFLLAKQNLDGLK
jgi:tetratricopeptide (TPR) repeat protein